VDFLGTGATSAELEEGCVRLVDSTELDVTGDAGW